MKEIKKFENKLLDRVEYVFETQASSTPSRHSVKAEIVKKLKADEKLVSIQGITSHYGSRTIHVSAYVYSDLNVMQQLVPKHIAKRNEAPEQEVVQEETPAAPVEEVAEESAGEAEA